jgi:hypothetical protein
MLAPIRESFATGTPVRWARVNSLPDYAYFQHDIHVHKGVGCETCHGRIDQMPLTWKASTLHMDWCVDCHRNPTPYLRPRERVFEMGYFPAGVKPAPGSQVRPPALPTNLNVETQRITDCATCHR